MKFWIRALTFVVVAGLAFGFAVANGDQQVTVELGLVTPEELGQARQELRGASADSDPIYFSPRSMPPWARLVGVGWHQSNWGIDADITLGKLHQTGAYTSLENLSSTMSPAGPISTSAGAGFYFVGSRDFTQPIWGNGTTYGPLFSFLQDFEDVNGAETPVQALGDAADGITRLALRFGNGGSSWSIGDYVYSVRFYYLY